MGEHMTDDKQASEQATAECDYCSDEYPEGELTDTADNAEACPDCLTGHKCFNCNEAIAKDTGSICDADGDYWCEDCGNGHLGYCDRCEEYSDYDEMLTVEGDSICGHCIGDVAYYCEGCEEYHYDTNECCDHRDGERQQISDEAERRVNPERQGSDTPTGRYRATRDSLVPLSGQAKRGAEWLYTDYLDYYKHTNRYLPRNASSVGIDGWFEVPLGVESPLHREVANTLYWAVRNATDHTFHHSQHDADYHPFRHLFGFAFKSNRVAQFWTLHPHSQVNDSSLRKERIEQAVRDNRLPDGSKLTRKVSRLLARYRKHPDCPDDNLHIQSANWPLEFCGVGWSPSKTKDRTRSWNVWTTFLTNACYLKVVGQLGWDAAALKDLVRHAEAANSCQTRSNKDDYTFGAASLLCNDYRLLFFRNADTGKVVARSVVRYYRHGRYVMLAPSRLYLTEGNSSGTYHLAAFDLLTRFCEAANRREAKKPQQPRDSYGRFTQKLTWLPVAYSETSNSGGDSITSHLMEAGRGKYVARPLAEVIGYSGTIWTDFTPTFWLEQPTDHNAHYYYYNEDESISINYCRMNGGDSSPEQGSFQYVMRAGTCASGLTAYTPTGGGT